MPDHDALQQTVDDAFSEVAASVVPLYCPRGRRVPMHVGCGVIATVGARICILTAAHVHRGIMEHTSGEVFVGALGRMHRVAGEALVSEADPGEREDSVDAAVILLKDDDESEALRPVAISLQHDARYDEVEVGRGATLRGYPHNRAERVRGGKIDAQAYLWHGYTANANAVPGLPRSSARRIAIEMPLDQLVDIRGVRGQSVSTAGCSGAGLWHFEPTVRPRLLGIFTEVRGDYFVGTSVRSHLGLLWQHAPYLFQESGTT